MFLSKTLLLIAVVTLASNTTPLLVSGLLHNGGQRKRKLSSTFSLIGKGTMRGGSTELNLSPIATISKVYAYAITNHYLATQAATMSIFSGMGDALAQIINRTTQGATKHNWKRTKRFMFKGIVSGIIWTTWYQINESWSSSITTAAASSLSMAMSPRTKIILHTVSSVLMEQFIASPIVFALWDIPILSLLSGTRIGKIPNAVRQKLVPLLIANAKLWTPVNVLIYNVPVKWRVVALSCADMVWLAILSSMTSDPHGEEEVNDVLVPVSSVGLA